MESQMPPLSVSKEFRFSRYSTRLWEPKCFNPEPQTSPNSSNSGQLKSPNPVCRPLQSLQNLPGSTGRFAGLQPCICCEGSFLASPSFSRLRTCFPRGSIYTTIMELGPQNHNGDGLLGPNSIIVVYMDPLGLTSDQSSGRSKTRWWSSCVEVRPLQEQHNIGALTARRGFGVYYRVILVAEFIRPKRCTLLFLEWEVFSQKV